MDVSPGTCSFPMPPASVIPSPFVEMSRDTKYVLEQPYQAIKNSFIFSKLAIQSTSLILNLALILFYISHVSNLMFLIYNFSLSLSGAASSSGTIPDSVNIINDVGSR